MNDIAPELFDEIMKRFERNRRKNKTIARCLAAADKGTATYREAYYYAQAVGECMSDALLDTITAERLPDGHMYFNIAERTVRPALEHVGELCGTFSDRVQLAMNEAAGLGLRPVENVNTD